MPKKIGRQPFMQSSDEAFDPTIRLMVSGERACFPRTEIERARVSYDVMTPYAANSILQSVHWLPAIRWSIDRIHVLEPIRFVAVKRGDRYFSDIHLDTVRYVIDARIELTDRAVGDDTVAKHRAIFCRRVKRGETYRPAFLGQQVCPAELDLVKRDSPLASSLLQAEQDRDLGWLLYKVDTEGDRRRSYFRAILRNGAVEVPPLGSDLIMW